MSWVDLPDSLFDPGKPILGSTHMQARDNLQAAFEGGAGAPGLSTKAMEDVTAGDSTRWEFSLGTSGSIEEEVYIQQTGTIRCTISTTGAGNTGSASIKRYRPGAGTTTMSTGSEPRSVDVSVLPGDKIIFESNMISGIRTWFFRLKTSGENLWPGAVNYLYG